jgi:hypothetical protein
MPRNLYSIPLTRKDVLKSMVNRSPQLRGVKMCCGFRSMCATPCRCMKSTASNNCLATDHKCASGLSIPISQPPATGIDITVPPSTGQIRTPAMVWFAGDLIPVRYCKNLISCALRARTSGIHHSRTRQQCSTLRRREGTTAICQHHIPGRCEDTYPEQNEVDFVIHLSRTA